jgi:hypothetical protein
MISTVAIRRKEWHNIGMSKMVQDLEAFFFPFDRDAIRHFR